VHHGCDKTSIVYSRGSENLLTVDGEDGEMAAKTWQLFPTLCGGKLEAISLGIARHLLLFEFEELIF
jgi:hypothetical protein